MGNSKSEPTGRNILRQEVPKPADHERDKFAIFTTLLLPFIHLQVVENLVKLNQVIVEFPSSNRILPLITNMVAFDVETGSDRQSLVAPKKTSKVIPSPPLPPYMSSPWDAKA